MNRNKVIMLSYKRIAKRSIKKAIVTKEIDPSLQAQIDALHAVNPEKLDLIRTMAIGLTEWINKVDGSPRDNKIKASKRILNCYIAQLEGKTDETATELDLSSLDLKSLPAEIGKLASLKILHLQNNQLTSIPPEIGKLTNLTTLNLCNNQLSSLPPETGNLTNLK